MYNFALCTYFIIHGKPHTPPDTNDTNAPQVDSCEYDLMHEALIACLSEDPARRLSFEVLRKEIFVNLINELCYEEEEAAHSEAVALMDKHASPDLVNYRDMLN